MYDRLFREYLYLQSQMIEFLVGIDRLGGKITNNEILLCIFFIKHQLNQNTGLTKSQLNEFRLMQNKTIYRTLNRCMDKGYITEQDDIYKFNHEIPPHLKMD